MDSRAPASLVDTEPRRAPHDRREDPPSAWKDWLEGRWFALADLSCAALAAAWWTTRLSIGWWPLTIGLVPWVLRALAGRAPFRHTAFDALVALFGLTAVGGVWAAYNRETAEAKFWVIAGAILLFYAVAGQPRANLGIVTGLLVACSALISASFLLGHDWRRDPADFAGLNQLGAWWTAWRPTVDLRAPPPNFAGGQLAALVPLAVAGLGWSWRARQRQWCIATVLAGAVVLAGLVMTSSRAAWLALAAGAGVWMIWRLCVWSARRTRLHPKSLFVIACLTLFLLLVCLALAQPAGPIGLVDNLPGLQDGSSRLSLALNTYRLVADLPFIGGGLGSFPGLYSHYMLGIPVFMFGYSHNLYLDVALEQGVLGAAALAGIMLGGLWLVGSHAQRPSAMASSPPLHWPIVVGLVVLCLHGLLDDAFYGLQGTPMLFVLTGLAAAASTPGPALAKRTSTARTWTRWLPGLAILTAAIGLAPSSKALQASWLAEVGSAAMSRVELASWRDDAINDFGEADLGRPEGLFQRALALDPDNRTAHYRLGLIALRRNDFMLAAVHLQAALARDPLHRGVIKALGYDYVWLGQSEMAYPLLARIPEARSEMDFYAWWWASQGHDDLARQAAAMAKQLAGLSQCLPTEKC